MLSLASARSSDIGTLVQSEGGDQGALNISRKRLTAREPAEEPRVGEKAGDLQQPRSSVGDSKGLRQEMRDLKELVAELSLENRLLKKNMIGHGGGEE